MCLSLLAGNSVHWNSIFSDILYNFRCLVNLGYGGYVAPEQIPVQDDSRNHDNGYYYYYYYYYQFLPFEHSG